MKKNYILSLIAALMMVLGANAQGSNTYNMVIKMADGTSITIGPNEIDNIAFNDGAVVVEGAKIDDLVADIQALKARNQAMEEVLAIHDERMYYGYFERIRGEAKIINPDTNEPYTYRAYENGSYVDKPVTIGYMVNKIDDNYTKTVAQIDALHGQIAGLEGNIQALVELINRLEARIAALEDQISH